MPIIGVKVDFCFLQECISCDVRSTQRSVSRWVLVALKINGGREHRGENNCLLFIQDYWSLKNQSDWNQTLIVVQMSCILSTIFVLLMSLLRRQCVRMHVRVYEYDYHLRALLVSLNDLHAQTALCVCVCVRASPNWSNSLRYRTDFIPYHWWFYCFACCGEANK